MKSGDCLHVAILPMVSIILPVHNEAATIAEVLRSVMMQDYPKERFEAIVVDDYSTDATPEIVKGFSAEYVRNPHNMGIARSLNVGLKKASGEIVLTLHGDCFPLGRGWIRRLVGHFSDPQVGAVTAYGMSDLARLSLLERCFHHIYTGADEYSADKLQDVAVEVSAIGTKCAAFRKSLLEKVRGFDEALTVSCEDADISGKIRGLRYKMMVDKGVVFIAGLGSHERTVASHFRKAAQYANPLILCYMRYGFIHGLDKIVPTVMLGYTLAIATAALTDSITPLFLVAEYLTALLVSAFALRVQLKMYLRDRADRASGMSVASFSMKKMCGKLLATILGVCILAELSRLMGMAAITVLAALPAYFGLSVLSVNAITRATSFFVKQRRFVKGLQMTLGIAITATFSLLWDILFCLGFFEGIIKYIRGSTRF